MRKSYSFISYLLTVILWGEGLKLCISLFLGWRKWRSMLAGSNEDDWSVSRFKSFKAKLSRSDSLFVVSVRRGKLCEARSSIWRGDMGPVEEALERWRERNDEKAPSWWLVVESNDGLRGGRWFVLEDRTSLTVWLTLGKYIILKTTFLLFLNFPHVFWPFLFCIVESWYHQKLLGVLTSSPDCSQDWASTRRTFLPLHLVSSRTSDEEKDCVLWSSANSQIIVNYLLDLCSYLPACRAGVVSPLCEVRQGPHHPVIDLAECQPSVRGTLYSLYTHNQPGKG